MYTPAAFKIDDREQAIDFMRRHSFATVSTCLQGQLLATHTPMVPFEDESGALSLFGHFAKANPQTASLDNGCEMLIVFSGPHGYISPRWYRQTPAVPTWNYAAVHARGIARRITDSGQLTRHLLAMIKANDPELYSERDVITPDNKIDQMLRGISGFSLRVDSLEMKMKLSQNRPLDDRHSVIEALDRSSTCEQRALARMMEQQAAST